MTSIHQVWLYTADADNCINSAPRIGVVQKGYDAMDAWFYPYEMTGCGVLEPCANMEKMIYVNQEYRTTNIWFHVRDDKLAAKYLGALIMFGKAKKEETVNVFYLDSEMNVKSDLYDKDYLIKKGRKPGYHYGPNLSIWWEKEPTEKEILDNFKHAIALEHTEAQKQYFESRERAERFMKMYVTKRKELSCSEGKG